MIIADTHVHIYPDFRLGRLLDGAVKRMSSLLYNSPRTTDGFVLVVHDRVQTDFFCRLAAGGAQLPEHWQVWTRPEEHSILLRRTDGMVLVVIAGRQVATKERLEVLAIGTQTLIPDGFSLEESVDAIHRAAALPVICWAAGKWAGARGKLLKLFLKSDTKYILGDSRMRPQFWPSKIFEQAGVLIAGSDPLPFLGEEDQVGQLCSIWEEEIDLAAPLKQLRKLIIDGQGVILGKRLSSYELALTSLKMRMPWFWPRLDIAKHASP